MYETQEESCCLVYEAVSLLQFIEGKFTIASLGGVIDLQRE